jgi:phosphoinositide-3-kinase regulatory subunit 4
MGNQLAAAQTSGYQDQQVLQQRLGDFQLVDQLGGGRFLKSFMCLHDEGQLVMKIYTKREAVSLARVARDLEAMRDKFNRNWPECCNVAAFTRVVETERGAYLLRQHVHHNLYERVSQRPFLHMIERKWIAYQLLQALVQSHACGVCHGDIKTENVVLTAWDWVLLADFAPFKPRTLPDDNPADFSFFFDTPGKQGRPGRRLCYVAPERFTSGDKEALPAPAPAPVAAPAPEVVGSPAPPVRMPSESGFTVPGADLEEFEAAPTSSTSSTRSMGEEWRPSGGELSPAQDVFSLGCVIAELFANTTTPTFSYAEMLRYRKEREAFPLEAKLQEIEDPEVRKMVRSMLSLDPTMRESAAEYLESRTPSIFPAYFSEFLHRFMARLLRTSHDEKITLIAASQDEILATLVGADSEPSESGLIMIANVVIASLPHLTTPWIKVEALRLLGKFAAHVDDDTRLQRLLPHILSVAEDESTVVRAACITAATAVVEPVVDVPPMDMFLFPEYILPAFKEFPNDEDVGVRIAHATCVGPLANAAHTFHRARWDLLEQKKADDLGDAESDEDDEEEDEHEEVLKMREDFKQNILAVLCDPNPTVRRAGLHGVLRLGTFFGESLSTELLPHIIANLNDKDWELRAAFFDSITNVAICVGQTAVTEFILPCIVQALTDYEKFVIENALHALAVLYELALLDTNVILDVLEKQVTVMICHPTLPVRSAAVACVLACASQLSMAEVHCKLLPILRPYLKTSDIVVVNEDSLLELLRPPLSKGEWDKIVHSTPQNAEATMRIFDTCAEWVDQKYAPSAADEIKSKADEVVGNAFRTYDPNGMVELEDREKLVLMRNYIRDFHAKTQTTIALWESENMERMQAGGNMGGEMTPYFTLSQRVTAYRKPIGGAEGSEGLDYAAPAGTDVAEGSTHPVTTAKAAAAAAANAAATTAPPVTPMRSGGGGSALGDAVPPPPTPEASGAAALATASENISVAAWPSEKLRMYAVPPAALVTASSSASVVVAGTQIHTADDYGGAVSGGPSGTELGDETDEDLASGLLPAELDTWRPHGALCAHIHEHKAAVNAFSVSADGSYFVSASDDGTVKLWQNSALAAHADEASVGMELHDEPALTQAWYTYTQQSGRILDVCTYGGGGALATASDAGSIHCIAMVDGGVVRLRRIAPNEGAITKLATVPHSPDLLIYATEGGSLHCADKRAPTEAWCCDGLAPYGLTTGIVVGTGAEWLAASSSRGFVSIWCAAACYYYYYSIGRLL